MQPIFDWLTGVLALLLCAAVVDMMIPESNMQKYVRLTAGFVIITAMITPLFSFDFSVQFRDEQKRNLFQQQTDDHLKELTETTSLTADPYIEQQLLIEAESVMQSFPSCQLKSVEADVQQNELDRVTLKAAGSCPREKIIRALSQKWNMEAGRLNMVIQKEDSGGE